MRARRMGILLGGVNRCGPAGSLLDERDHATSPTPGRAFSARSRHKMRPGVAPFRRPGCGVPSRPGVGCAASQGQLRDAELPPPPAMRTGRTLRPLARPLMTFNEVPAMKTRLPLTLTVLFGSCLGLAAADEPSRA